MTGLLWFRIITNRNLFEKDEEELSKFLGGFLKKRNPRQIKLFIKLFYRPREITPVLNWHTGYRPSGQTAYRLLLKLLWEQFKTANFSSVQIKWYNNVLIAVPTKSEVAECLLLGGYYEPGEMLFLKNFLKEGMTFIDIGAHIGLYTAFAASIVGRSGKVVAFEPSSREYGFLRKNVRVWSNVLIHKIALGDKCAVGRLKIADDVHSGHNTLGNFVYSKIKSTRAEKAQVVTLDSLSGEWPRVDFVKIDVEGYEDKVLLGARRTIAKFRPIILMEISDWSSVKVFKNYGYYLYSLNGSNLINPSGNGTDFKTTNIIASPKRLARKDFS